MLESSLEVTVTPAVTFTFEIVNGGDSPVTLTFRDGCRADFIVWDGDQEVWRYSNNRAFSQAISTANLNPGELATFTESWPDPIPGAYTAEAVLRVMETELTDRTAFEI